MRTRLIMEESRECKTEAAYRSGSAMPPTETHELARDAMAAFAAPLGYASLSLMSVKRTADEMLKNMAIHYSQPRGFVGRNICYLIMAGGVCYGSIAGGSATRFLPGREVVGSLNNGVNNIFYHVEKRNGEYPARNFTASVLKLYRETIERDWLAKYNDAVLGTKPRPRLAMLNWRESECHASRNPVWFRGAGSESRCTTI